MLVLKRKVGEKIVIPDLGTTISVVGVSGNRVRIGIAAPSRVRVTRSDEGKVQSSSPPDPAPEAASEDRQATNPLPILTGPDHEASL